LAERLRSCRAATAHDERRIEKLTWIHAEPSLFQVCENVVTKLRIVQRTAQVRRTVVRFEQRHCALLAKISEPALDEPGGMGMDDAQSIGRRKVCCQQCVNLDRKWRSFVLSGKAAQDRVYQRCCRTFSRPFHKLDGFVDSRPGRNTLEETQLIKTHAQGERNGKVETG